MKATIFSNDFDKLIDATKAFVEKVYSVRNFTKYIKLIFDSVHSEVTAVAVDGFRMSVEHSIISDCDEDFTVFIKPTIKLPKNEYATIELDGEEVIIRGKSFLFGYKQPEKVEQFDFNNVLPKKEPLYRIGFNGNYLLDALKAAKASCGDCFKSPVILEVHDPNMPAIIRTNKNDIKMILPVRLKD